MEGVPHTKGEKSTSREMDCHTGGEVVFAVLTAGGHRRIVESREQGSGDVSRTHPWVSFPVSGPGGEGRPDSIPGETGWREVLNKAC